MALSTSTVAVDVDVGAGVGATGVGFDTSRAGGPPHAHNTSAIRVRGLLMPDNRSIMLASACR